MHTPLYIQRLHTTVISKNGMKNRAKNRTRNDLRHVHRHVDLFSLHNGRLVNPISLHRGGLNENGRKRRKHADTDGHRFAVDHCGGTLRDTKPPELFRLLFRDRCAPAPVTRARRGGREGRAHEIERFILAAGVPLCIKSPRKKRGKKKTEHTDGAENGV